MCYDPLRFFLCSYDLFFPETAMQDYDETRASCTMHLAHRLVKSNLAITSMIGYSGLSRKGCTHACASILSSRTHACGLDNFFWRQDNPEGCSGHVTMLDVRQRPYRNEHTGSHPNSKVNRCRARSVLGWGTAWEALWVLLAFLRIKFLIRCRFDFAC